MFGRLAVCGSVSLDGTLTVTLVNAYTPSSGDAFRMLTYIRNCICGRKIKRHKGYGTR
jgi:hypothetical protein